MPFNYYYYYYHYLVIIAHIIARTYFKLIVGKKKREATPEAFNEHAIKIYIFNTLSQFKSVQIY